MSVGLYTGQTNSTSCQMLKIIFALALLGAFVNLLSPSGGGTTAATTGASPGASRTAPVRNTTRDTATIVANIALTVPSWQLGGFDSIMLANFDIKNNNAFAVKDIEVECTHFAKSGTRIDSNNKTIFDVFAPNTVVKIRKFNMGFIHSQAERTNCSVKSANIAD